MTDTVSLQLQNALSSAFGPHAANELILALGKPTDPVLRLNKELEGFDREIVSLKQSLDAALIRIEHLERAAKSSPMSAAFEATKEAAKGDEPAVVKPEAKE